MARLGLAAGTQPRAGDERRGDAAQVEAGSDGQVSDFANHLAWNVPCYIGEWNDMGQGAAAYDYSINDYNTADMSWCMWAYKAADGLVPDGWGWYDPTYWPTTPNIASDSAAAIAADWQQWRTTTSFRRQQRRGAVIRGVARAACSH